MFCFVKEYSEILSKEANEPSGDKMKNDKLLLLSEEKSESKNNYYEEPDLVINVNEENEKLLDS